MESECQLAKDGLYIIYANMLCTSLGDGGSALFCYHRQTTFSGLVDRKKADLSFESKVYQLKKKFSYAIFRN